MNDKKKYQVSSANVCSPRKGIVSAASVQQVRQQIERDVKLENQARKLAQQQRKSLWQVFNPTHMKLHLLKQAINYTTAMTKDLIPDKPPVSAIAVAVDATFRESVEMLQAAPEWHDDKNFPRLLETLRRAAVFIADEDGYYRGWLEMFCAMLAENVAKTHE